MTDAKDMLSRFRDHVIRHVTQWDDAANGSHHHPIWVGVAEALTAPPAPTEINAPHALSEENARKYSRAIWHFRLRYREAEEGQFESVKIDPYEAEQLLELLGGEES